MTARARMPSKDRMPCNRRHEIELKAIIIPHNSIQTRRRIVRPQDRATELTRDRLELAKVRRRLAKQEIEIDGCHRRALQSRRRVAYQHSLEVELPEQGSDFDQKRLGVHSVPV